MKTITFKRCKYIGKLKPERMTGFRVEGTKFWANVTDECLDDLTNLKILLATFWFKAHPNDKAQDIDFKIEL